MDPICFLDLCPLMGDFAVLPYLWAQPCDPLGRKAMTNLDGILKSRDITLPTKVHIVKTMVFPVSHVWMWELDHEEGWALKNWCFWTVVLKTLESPLDCKEIKPLNPKGNQSWIFIGRTDAEAETTILWLPDAKIWLIRKDPDAWKDWKREEKGMTEDEMVGWHHRQDGYEFGWTPGIGWWTGWPGVLQSMGLQRVRHDWVTEQQQMWPATANEMWVGVTESQIQPRFGRSDMFGVPLLYLIRKRTWPDQPTGPRKMRYPWNRDRQPTHSPLLWALRFHGSYTALLWYQQVTDTDCHHMEPVFTDPREGILPII